MRGSVSTGERKTSQVLDASGLLDFTMSRSVSLGGPFETYEPFISLIFQLSSGRGEPRITETADSESLDTGHNCTYMIPLVM
jgi:hypothetical protein